MSLITSVEIAKSKWRTCVWCCVWVNEIVVIDTPEAFDILTDEHGGEGLANVFF